VRAIRGAISVSGNTPEAIGEATHSLLAAIQEKNQLEMTEVVSVLFTLTPDLDADFPARTARSAGWEAPMLDMVEVDVPGGLPCCLRVLVHVDRTDPVQHAYLRGARLLRPDLE
jgi:chorismate mutase